MSTGKSGTSKSSGATTVTIDTRMEVRGYYYELHVWIARRKRGNDAFFYP